MFDKLIDVILEFIGLFKFWTVIDCYEKGVVLQLGKYRRTLDAGFYFICPFSIDEVMVDNVVIQTMDMGTQSLHDIDGVKIVLSSFITYKITDIKVFLTEVESAQDVIMSFTYGIISTMIQKTDWEGIQKKKFGWEVKNRIANELDKFGVTLLNIDFQNMSESKTLRLLTDDINVNMGEED